MYLQNARDLLQNIEGRPLSSEERLHYTFQLANLLLEATLNETTPEEREQEEKISRMVKDPRGKMFMTLMTDECFRSQSAPRTADQLHYLLEILGIPHFLLPKERLQFLMFKLLGKTFPHFFIPKIKKQIRKEMRHVLIPENPKEQQKFFKRSYEKGTRINLNHLGEAILGEEEAARRLNIYLEDLKNPHIDYISVKISTIYSQISMIGWQESLEILSERLRQLYRAAMSSPYQMFHGEQTYKFVNLDMEEYRDLDLTVALFQKVLDEPEFATLTAGIVLQSYLPDSFEIQKKLTEWAIQRVEAGGAPIKIRLVKGANLAMEKVESSIRGWAQAPYSEKKETDANYKRMISYGCHPQNAKGVLLGIGSHNLLDIAYAFILRGEYKTESQVGFEMLQGMAEPMKRVVQQLSGGMVVYGPEAKEKNFHAAVAYLIRRLDENTGPYHFLRHLFELTPSSSAWEQEKNRFQEAYLHMENTFVGRRRQQNRLLAVNGGNGKERFLNESDTDFSLPENRNWAKNIYEDWKSKTIPPIPLVIEGKMLTTTLENGFDPSRPQVPFYQYSSADIPLASKALDSAHEAFSQWSATSLQERSHLLAKTAYLFKKARNNLIGSMIADAGKTLLEADPEVSEAIDFLEYYRRNWEKVGSYPDIEWKPLGVVLVAPPWNFPCSIPVGGIAAALMTGNCVLFKPAPETVLVGWELVQLFWKAGIPKTVLQWINCPDDPVGSFLIKDPRLNGVILTGATETAHKLIKMRPSLNLFAETGGKNAMIVTSMSDRDLSIRDIIHSAFGHGGQKCSACSLAILENELYDDERFLQQLKDAAQSLTVGSAWNMQAKVTPLIREPTGALKRALHTLDEGESWLLEPKQDSENPQLFSPGIKMGVKEGSFTHQTELFGPILALMRADNLEHAIRMANGTPYGLTSGLHSLDSREHAKWKSQIEAGNLYINRGVTGAIVQRQPFGGCKASHFGPGAKAGGPNFLKQLAHPKQIGFPKEKAPLPAFAFPWFSALNTFNFTEKEIENIKKSVESYAFWSSLFKEPSDASCLLGQDNLFYYVSKNKVVLRVSQKISSEDFRASMACILCKTPLEISLPEIPKRINASIPFQFVQEDEMTFLERLKNGQIPFLRMTEVPKASLLEAAASSFTPIIYSPVLSNGRFELLYYLREVALSYDYHRYGNLGLRERLDVP